MILKIRLPLTYSKLKRRKFVNYMGICKHLVLSLHNMDVASISLLPIVYHTVLAKYPIQYIRRKIFLAVAYLMKVWAEVWVCVDTVGVCVV